MTIGAAFGRRLHPGLVISPFRYFAIALREFESRLAILLMPSFSTRRQRRLADPAGNGVASCGTMTSSAHTPGKWNDALPSPMRLRRVASVTRGPAVGHADRRHRNGVAVSRSCIP